MKRILIAEDHPHVIRVLKFALEREGYEVQTVSNGEEALASLAESFPDALISDIMMPRMNGKKLLEKISQNYPERTFLIMIMTSLTERSEIKWIAQYPNIEFLEKQALENIAA